MADQVADKMEVWTPQLFQADDVMGEPEGGEPEGSEEIVTEPTETGEPEIEVEGKTTKVEGEPNEIAELKKTISSLKDEILSLASRKKETPIEEPKGEPAKEKLTRAQIAQILTEHKDDPAVLLNIIDYIAEEKALATRDETVKDISHKQWYSNLQGMGNQILTEDQDGYLAANPQVKASLEESATNFGLADHPLGRLATYAIIRLSESVKGKGKVEGDSTTPTSTSTSTRVMDKTRATSKTSKTSGLTQEQLNTAKRFGVKPETYAKFVRRG